MPQEIGLKEFHPNNITAKMNKTTIDSKNIKMSPELQWEGPPGVVVLGPNYVKNTR